jgi:hypothetical protein
MKTSSHSRKYKDYTLIVVSFDSHYKGYYRTHKDGLKIESSYIDLNGITLNQAFNDFINYIDELGE